MTVDLSRLPPPDIVEIIDFETIFQDLIDDFKDRSEAYNNEIGLNLVHTAITESDPAYKVFEAEAYREIILRQRINEAAQAVMIPYAQGADLEALVALANIERQVIQQATDDQPEILESDERLLRRYYLSWDAISTAGPEGAYKFMALSASENVFDVTASSPLPSEADVVILPREGAVESEVLAAVSDVLSDENGGAPQGDRVTVTGANVIDYTVDGVLRMPAGGPDANLVKAAADSNVLNYVTWSESQGSTPLGRNIYIARLLAAMAVEGVIEPVLTSPAANIICDSSQAARCTGVNLTIELVGD